MRSIPSKLRRAGKWNTFVSWVAARESAKELRLFGLGSFLVHRYRALSHEVHEQTFALARRRLIIGLLFALLEPLGITGPMPSRFMKP